MHKLLKQERDLVIESRPLEATAFQVENIRMASVFYESGLSISVMYTIDDLKKRAVGFRRLRRHEGPARARLPLQIRQAEVEARRDHPRLVLRDQGRVLRGARAESLRP